MPDPSPNKADELRLKVATNNIVRDICILVITETWLNLSILDFALELAGYTAQCQDRTRDTGKSRGGRL